MIASLGAVSVIIGLAFQDIIKDFLAGVFIIFDNEYAVGDIIEINGFKGEVISLGLKPLPFGFIRALKSLGSKRKNTAIVGDQIFTDVLGGNLVGVKTLLLTPILLESTAGFKFKRKIERVVFKLYRIKNTEV